MIKYLGLVDVGQLWEKVFLHSDLEIYGQRLYISRMHTYRQRRVVRMQIEVSVERITSTLGVKVSRTGN
jgi:hypothetical protein